MDSEEKIDASLDILKRMPPQETEKHLKNLTILLQPDSNAIEDLHHKVDCPLQTALDTIVNKPFVLSEYNRAEGEFYRSPWSNEYFPSPSSSSSKHNNDSSNNKNVEGMFFKPSGELRELEEQANEVFESYREMYYGKDSVGSVYLWNQGGGIQEGGFAGCFLIQKQICKQEEEEEEQNQSGPPKRSQSGYWNSIHVMDVNVLSGGDRVKYELSTTVLVSMDLIYSDGGNHSNKSGFKEEKNFVPMVVEIGGSMSKHKETIRPNPTSTTRGKLEHIANIGQMMEAVEIEIRSNIDTLSIQQTKDVLQGIRKDSMASSWAGYGGSNVVSGGSRSSSGVGIASLLRSTASQNPMQAELMARLKQRSTCEDISQPNK